MITDASGATATALSVLSTCCKAFSTVVGAGDGARVGTGSADNGASSLIIDAKARLEPPHICKISLVKSLRWPDGGMQVSSKGRAKYTVTSITSLKAVSAAT